MAAGQVAQLGCYDMRAHSESIRLLLVHANVRYEEKRYELGPPPTYHEGAWLEDKATLGLLLPCLPYWIEPQTGLRLSHEQAILWHLAETHGLAGETAAERAIARMVLEGLREWEDSFYEVTCCNMPNSPNVEPNVHAVGEEQCVPTSQRYELRRAAFVADKLPLALARWAAVLECKGISSGPREWIVGTRTPCVADFVLGELLAQSLILEPGCLDGSEFAPLRAFLKRFDALPAIAAYRASPQFRAEPLHNRYSHFHRGWVDGWARTTQPPNFKLSAKFSPLLPKTIEEGSAGSVATSASTTAIDDVAGVREAPFAPPAKHRQWRDMLVLLCAGLIIAGIVAIGRAANEPIEL